MSKQPAPRGISGGPLWRVTFLSMAQVWSASRAASVIGVCGSWDQESVEFCSSTLVWGDWLREVLIEIDGQA